MEEKPAEIRNCPFCGNVSTPLPGSSAEGGTGRWAVTCLGCLPRGPLRAKRGEAIQSWNRRAHEEAAAEKFEGWVILEALGYRRLGGYLRLQEIAGKLFLRIDVPGKDGGFVATPLYSPEAIYCITPVTEAMARTVALSGPNSVKRSRQPGLADGGEEDDDVDAW